jgi:3-hydroxyisobutyrate dehydrogenase-like beta-hydroxyacid dehydrogenase
VVINDNLAIHAKDIDYAMEAANQLHAYLPVTASTHEYLIYCQNQRSWEYLVRQPVHHLGGSLAEEIEQHHPAGR